MKKYWVLFSAYIEARRISERMLMFGAAAGVLITVLNTLLLDPIFERSDALRTMLTQQQSQIQALAERTRTLAQAMHEPSDAASQARLRTLENELAKTNISLDELLRHQVSPERMPTLLEDMLQQNHKVRLISFRTLAVTPFTITTEPAAKPANETPATPPSPEPIIYKHGVELTVEGSYNDLLGYLSELENLPWQLFFGDLVFTVPDYPHERITLVLYTLCTDRAWLSM